MRTVYIGGAVIGGGAEARRAEYYVVIDGLLNGDGETIGETCGVRVDIAAPPRGFFSETVNDVTTNYDEMIRFARKLRDMKVTPATLRDIVCDSLPL